MYNVSSFSGQGGASDRSDSLPCSSVLRFGKGRLCFDAPSAAAAVRCFGAAFPPRLQTEQQGTVFTFHPSKNYFGVLSDTANKKVTSWERWEDFHFCFPSGFGAIYVPLQLLPLLSSSTLCAVLPPEDLVEDFMRGSWCDFSPGCGIAHRKWCGPVASFLSVYSLACAHSCKELTLFFAASSTALVQPIPALVRLEVDMEWIMTWNNLNFQWNTNFLPSLAHI